MNLGQTIGCFSYERLKITTGRIYCPFDVLLFQVDFIFIWRLLLHTFPWFCGEDGSLWGQVDEFCSCYLLWQHLLPVTIVKSCYTVKETLCWWKAERTLQWLAIYSSLFSDYILCTVSVISQYLDVALGLLSFSSKQALLAKVRLVKLWSGFVHNSYRRQLE